MTRNQDPVHAALISDRRLTHNGFLIEHRKANNQSEDAQTVVKLLEKSTIPFFGVEELVEILDRVSDETDSNDGLKRCRPEKVKKYLSEEASRKDKKILLIFWPEFGPLLSNLALSCYMMTLT